MTLLKNVDEASYTKQTQLAARQISEACLIWSQYLPAAQAKLIERRHGRGLSYDEIAEETGWSPSMVRKKIQTIERTMRSQEFQFVAVYRKSLPRWIRAFAKYRCLHGRPLREIADRMSISLHRARRLDDSLKTAVSLFVSVQGKEPDLPDLRWHPPRSEWRKGIGSLEA